MTVATSAVEIEYAGNGVTTAFSTTFKFLENADVVVELIVASVATVKTITTHYTLAGAGVDAGGTVTMLTAPASGETLRISRVMDLTQETNFSTSGPFSPALHEAALDKLTMIAQQQKEEIDDIEAVSVDGIETLTNKTLTSPTITAPTITGGGTLAGTFAGGTHTGQTITSPSIGGTVAGGATYTTPVLTTPVVNGASTGTGVAEAATVSTLAKRDSSGDLTARKHLSTYDINASYYWDGATPATQTAAAATTTRVQFDANGTVGYDTHSAVTVGASWVFTVPAGAGGKYLVAFQLSLVGTLSDVFEIMLYRNGIVDRRLAVGTLSNAIDHAVSGACVVLLAATDTIDIRWKTVSNGSALYDETKRNWIQISRLPGA